MNFKQTASVLDMFWQLLEFNPDVDEEDIKQNELPQKGITRQPIAFIGDDIMDAEEEKMKNLLASKFQLFKLLIFGAIEHPDVETKISIEQAKRITAYTHETYFRHLRLYDYVLKNTKYCEIKKVTLPKIEPVCSDVYLLSKAMLLNTAHLDTDDEGTSIGSAMKSDRGAFSEIKNDRKEQDHVLN